MALRRRCGACAGASRKADWLLQPPVRPASSGRPLNRTARYPARGSSPRLANRRDSHCLRTGGCNGPAPATGLAGVRPCRAPCRRSSSSPWRGRLSAATPCGGSLPASTSSSSTPWTGTGWTKAHTGPGCRPNGGASCAAATWRRARSAPCCRTGSSGSAWSRPERPAPSSWRTMRGWRTASPPLRRCDPATLSGWRSAEALLHYCWRIRAPVDWLYAEWWRNGLVFLAVDPAIVRGAGWPSTIGTRPKVRRTALRTSGGGLLPLGRPVAQARRPGAETGASPVAGRKAVV